MSSLRNAMKTQKVHQERHQNEARAHLGPLEKKKDYKIRALDQAKKKKLLKKLHQKALERNPDEYYEHMNESNMVDGRHIENAPVRHKSKQNLQADLRYVDTRRSMETNKIAKLRASLHFLETNNEEEEPQNSHILFVETAEEAKTKTAAELLHTHPDLLGRRFNRPTTEQLQQLTDTLDVSKKDMRNASTAKAKAYKELCRRIARDEQLRVIQGQLRHKLDMMNHEEANKKRKIKHPDPKEITPGTAEKAPLFKWHNIRKK